MRVRVRIKEGAARGVCGSCRLAWITRDSRERTEVRCTSTNANLVVNRVLVECSEHHARGTLDTWEMEKIAWVVDVDLLRKGKPGFLAPPKKEK